MNSGFLDKVDEGQVAKLYPYGEPVIFSATGNRPLAECVCRELSEPLAPVDIFEFQNQNIFVKLRRSVRGHDVFLIQGLGTNVNHNIMEMLIFIDALKRASAARITVVLPFYAYGQSDKKDQPRVPITARLIADMIVTAGANRYITIDLHAGQIQGFFSIPGDELTALPILVNYIEDKHIENLVVVSADLGFAKKARNFARRLDAPLAFVEKRRIPNSHAEALTVIGEVAGKNAVLVDELVDTGGTLTAAVDLLMKSGAKTVHTACTHATLSGNALERLQKAPIEEFICTDTVDVPPSRRLPNFHILSVAPLLAEVIRRTNEGRSVGDFLKDT